METKICGQCGATIERNKRDLNEWNRLQYCSRRCSGLASGARQRQVIDAELGGTKTCPHCGGEFSRPRYAGRAEWAARIFCSAKCSANHRHVVGEYLGRCDCGAQADSLVWLVQGTADGRLRVERTEVCADCVDMWLEDGATLQRPTLPKGVRLWNEAHESSELPAAHVSGWHGIQGARP